MALALYVNQQEDFFRIENTGNETIDIKGYCVKDQGVFEGRTKRNCFKFNDSLPLSPGNSVTVYSGNGSGSARDYDGVAHLHWFNFSVWKSGRGYLIHPDGNVTESQVEQSQSPNEQSPSAQAETESKVDTSMEIESKLDTTLETKEAEAKESAAEEVQTEAKESAAEEVQTEAKSEAESAENEEATGTSQTKTEVNEVKSESKDGKSGSVEVKNPDVERPDGTKLSGVCKWFNVRKFYGFLHDLSDGGPEVFVHASSINSDEDIKALVPGHKYEFIWKNEGEAKNGDHKGSAENVSKFGGGKVTTHASQRRSFLLKRLKDNADIKLGTLKWFNSDKGYGFILPFHGYGEKDVFVNHRELNFVPGVTNLEPGTHVEYKLKVLDAKDKDGNPKITAIEVGGPGGEPLGVVAPARMQPIIQRPLANQAFHPRRPTLYPSQPALMRMRAPQMRMRAPQMRMGAPQMRMGAPQMRMGTPHMRMAQPMRMRAPLITQRPRAQVLRAHARSVIIGQKRKASFIAAPNRGPVRSGGYGILQVPNQRRQYF